MCNEIARRIELGLIREDFSQLRIPLRFPEGLPNLAPLDSIRITDPAAIVRRGADGEAELVQRRWSWPGPSGKPVYNMRSEGRSFATGRCLIPADGFFEFTNSPSLPREGAGGWVSPADAQPSLPLPSEPPTPNPSLGREGGRKRKTRWLFTKAGEPWFCIAGLWRTDAAVGEAFTMLTTAPGPDVAPYHDRQIVVLDRGDWVRWLDPATPAADLLRPSPAGSLTVRRVG